MRFLLLSPALVLLLASTVDALRLGGGCSMSSRRAAIAGAVACTMPAAAHASVSKMLSNSCVCLLACCPTSVLANGFRPLTMRYLRSMRSQLRMMLCCRIADAIRAYF